MAQPKVRGSRIRPACWQGPASPSVFEASGICATSHLPEEATRPTQAPPPRRASAWLAARAGLAARAPGSGRGLGWGLTTCSAGVWDFDGFSCDFDGFSTVLWF